MPTQGLQRRVFAKKDYSRCTLLSPQNGIEKNIVNMDKNDHSMRDTVVRVIGPWEAEFEDERGAVPIAWNLDFGSYGELCLPLMLRRS